MDTFGTRPNCPVYRGVHISGVLRNVDTWGNRPKSPVFQVNILLNWSYEKLILKAISTLITAVALRNLSLA